MNGKILMSKKHLTKALSRFDSVTRRRGGLGSEKEYMLNIPPAIANAVMVIFVDQVPEDGDTRIIREAMGELSYRFEEDNLPEEVEK